MAQLPKEGTRLRQDTLQMSRLRPQDGHGDGSCFIRDHDYPARHHTSSKQSEPAMTRARSTRHQRGLRSSQKVELET